MAEPLKNLLNEPVVREIARQLGRTGRVHEAAFLGDALDGLYALELMQRSEHIARALSRHLPSDYGEALKVLGAALHPDTEATLSDMSLDGKGLRGWSLAPFGNFVMTGGLAHPEESLRFLRCMTSRFTAEFAVRPFLRDYPCLALQHAADWASDRNVHVRRLASEGTRPRLPWGLRLQRFVADPSPLIPILTRLRDDPSDYVRRSVANSLNDISKDHPARIVALARDWLRDAPPARAALLKQACRTLIKAGDPEALALFGYAAPDGVSGELTVEPDGIALGESLNLRLMLTNGSAAPMPVLVDLVLHFLKANGTTAPKVFKWTETVLHPGEPVTLTRRLPLREVTTRRHYPGAQEVEAQVNGKALARASFELCV